MLEDLGALATMAAVKGEQKLRGFELVRFGVGVHKGRNICEPAFHVHQPAGTCSFPPHAASSSSTTRGGDVPEIWVVANRIWVVFFC